MGQKSGDSGMNGDWKVRKRRWWRSLAYLKIYFIAIEKKILRERAQRFGGEV